MSPDLKRTVSVNNKKKQQCICKNIYFIKFFKQLAYLVQFQQVIFLAHLSRRLMVSFCDHSPSVVVVGGGVVVVVVVVVRMSVCPQSLNNISS